MTTNGTFRELDEMSTYDLRGPEWEVYYAALIPWLLDGDADIRKRAIHRLYGAAFWGEGHAASQAIRDQAEYEQRPSGPWQHFDNAGRMSWLLSAFDTAHLQHRDIIPLAICEMLNGSVTGPDDPIMLWLDGLSKAPPPGVDPGMIDGAILMKLPFDEDDPGDVARLVALLDHPSNFVRACAAKTMSAREGAALDAASMFTLIKDKEIIRPGIAGAFWSEWWSCDDIPVDPVAWMMEILERRSGPEPDDMPFIGIDFYLHEICSRSPQMVHRMIACGHAELAIETATEMSDHVPGMEPVLRQLADHGDARIRHKAQFHLAHYYRVLHPEAEARGMVHHWPDWSPDADVFSFHHGEQHALWFIRLYPREIDGDFSDVLAWSLIDCALPPALRGDVDFHYMNQGKVPPPGPTRVGSMMLWKFSSGVTVDLQGDPDAKTWTHIAIGGFKLGDHWKPFSG